MRTNVQSNTVRRIEWSELPRWREPARLARQMTVLLMLLSACSRSEKAGPRGSDYASPLPLSLKVSSEIVGEGINGVSVTLEGKKVTLLFEDGFKPLTFELGTEPNATLSVRGKSLAADNAGVATITIVPVDELRAWFEVGKLPESSTGAPVEAQTELTITGKGASASGKATLTLDLRGTLQWWMNEHILTEDQQRLDEVRQLSAFEPGATGILFYTPKSTLRYAGPGGSVKTIGFFGTAAEQQPEVKDCGNYVTPTGEVGRVTYSVIQEAAAVHERSTYLVPIKRRKTADEGVSTWIGPGNPCKRTVVGSNIGKEIRPEPQQSTEYLLATWRDLLAKRKSARPSSI